MQNLNRTHTRIAMSWRAGVAALALVGTAGAWAADDAWVSDARSVATAIPPKLLAVLKQEIEQGGVEHAVGACNEKAPQMARAASQQTGWQIRRVSLRERNPKAVPDAWERATLEDFDRRAAAGENPATLERTEVVTQDGQAVQRYMRALPTQELCLSCHGDAARFGPGLKERLHSLYPADKATGYSVGQLRGAITLKRPAP